jgi:hypothetical protein
MPIVKMFAALLVIAGVMQTIATEARAAVLSSQAFENVAVRSASSTPACRGERYHAYHPGRQTSSRPHRRPRHVVHIAP